MRIGYRRTSFDKGQLTIIACNTDSCLLGKVEKLFDGDAVSVALDQACIDIINQQKVTATNDPTDLLNRIDKQHGIHTIEWAEKIGLGTRKYHIVSIDK